MRSLVAAAVVLYGVVGGTLTTRISAAGVSEDACTDNIENLRRIRPSECDPKGRMGPEIRVGNNVFDNDQFHFVIGSPTDQETPTARKTRKMRRSFKEDIHDNIIVYLPGTTDWPAVSSCLLQAVASNGIPTIGLTYAFLRRGDELRNTRCASLLPDTQATVECLTEQHNDAIYGGAYGAGKAYDETEFWQAIDPRDSIAGRLGLLLAKLDETHPEEGWDAFYSAASGTYPDSLPIPNWSMITFMGHSQGAGHAAYLAASREVNGAVLVSGPQDECTGCPAGTEFWIDDRFVSGSITAFAHGDASDGLEPTLPIMQDNWSRMGVWSSPLTVTNIDDYVNYNVCKTPVVSTIAPSATSTCSRRGHCSTAHDDSAPVLPNTQGKNIYIFGIDLWSSLANIDRCK